MKLDLGRLRMPRATAEADQGGDAMIRWYRHRAQAWLPRRIQSWAESMGVQPGDLDVRDLGYRWGSLGKNDRLNIHWAAMQLPVSLVDYVIVHELAHMGQPGTARLSGLPSNAPSPDTTSAAPALRLLALLYGSAEPMTPSALPGSLRIAQVNSAMIACG